jgi:hypothetical protein
MRAWDMYGHRMCMGLEYVGAWDMHGHFKNMHYS